MTTHKLDTEPLWVNIIRMFKDNKVSDEHVFEALMQLATNADIIRQAQKRGITLKLHPDGTIEELQ